MKKHTAWARGLLALSLVLLLSAGCEPSAAPALMEEPDMTEKTTPTVPAATPPAPRIPAAQPPNEDRPPMSLPFTSPVEMAAHDLAKRLGVDAEDVVIMDIQEMALPAADLGCPGVAKVRAEEAPGGMVQGQEITLAVGGRQYVYRAHGWLVVPCRPAAEFSDLPAPPRPGPVAAPVEPARQDLAQRLGVKAEDIAVQAVEAVEWSDASLGCPQLGMMYAQVITPGYRIRLQAGDQIYEYHSDQRRAILCEPKLRPGP